MKRYTYIENENYYIDNDKLENPYEETGYIDTFENVYMGAAIQKLGLLEDWIEGKITFAECREKFKNYLDNLNSL